MDGESPSKSRFGRTRKPKISADFYNTDELFAHRTNGKAKQSQAKPPVVVQPESRASPTPTKQMKFFKSKTSAESTDDKEPDIDVNKVMKLVTPRREFGAGSVVKGRPKTYSNRKRPHQTYVVESFGLPDPPIVPTTYDDVWEEETTEIAELRNEEPFSPQVIPQYVTPNATPRVSMMSTKTTDHLVVHESPDSPPVYIITTAKGAEHPPPKRSPQIKILEDIVFVKGRASEDVVEEEEVAFDLETAAEVVVEDDIDCRETYETFVLDDADVVLDVDGTPLTYVHSNVEFLDGFEGQVVEIAEGSEAISASLAVDDVVVDDNGEEGLVVCVASSSNELSLEYADDDEEEMLLQVEGDVQEVVDTLEANSTTSYSEEMPEMETPDEYVIEEETVVPKEDVPVPRESVPVSIKRSRIKSPDKSRLSLKKRSPKKSVESQNALVSSSRPNEPSPQRASKRRPRKDADGRIEAGSPKKVRTRKSHAEQPTQSDVSDEVAASPTKRLTRSSRTTEKFEVSESNLEIPKTLDSEDSNPNLQTSPETANVFVEKSNIEANSGVEEADTPNLQAFPQKTVKQNIGSKSEVSEPNLQMTEQSGSISEGTENLDDETSDPKPRKSLQKTVKCKLEVRKPYLRGSPQKALNPEAAANLESQETTLSLGDAAKLDAGNQSVVKVELTSSIDDSAKLEVDEPNLQTSPTKTAKSKLEVRKPNLRASAQKVLNPTQLEANDSNIELATSVELQVDEPNLQTSPPKTAKPKLELRKPSLRASQQKDLYLEAEKTKIVTTSSVDDGKKLEATEPNPQMSSAKAAKPKLEVRKPNRRASPQKGMNLTQLEANDSNIELASSVELEVDKPNLQTSPIKTVNPKSEVRKPNLGAPSRKGSNSKQLEANDSNIELASSVELEVGEPNLQTSPIKTAKPKSEARKPNLRASTQKALNSTQLEVDKSNIELASNVEDAAMLEVEEPNLQTSPMKAAKPKLEVRKPNLRASTQKALNSTQLEVDKSNIELASNIEDAAMLEIEEPNLQTSPIKAAKPKLEVRKPNLRASSQKDSNPTQLEAKDSNIELASSVEWNVDEPNLQMSPIKAAKPKLEARKPNLRASSQKGLRLQAEKTKTVATSSADVEKLEIDKPNLQTSPMKTPKLKLEVRIPNLRVSQLKRSTPTQFEVDNSNTELTSSVELEVSEPNLYSSPMKTPKSKFEVRKPNLRASRQKGSIPTRFEVDDSNTELTSSVELEVGEPNLQTSPTKTAKPKFVVKKPNLRASPQNTFNMEAAVSSKTEKTKVEATLSPGKAKKSDLSRRTSLIKTLRREVAAKLKVGKSKPATSSQKGLISEASASVEAQETNIETTSRKSLKQEVAGKLKVGKTKPGASTQLKAAEKVNEGVEKATSSVEDAVGKPNLRASPQKSWKSKAGTKLEVGKPKLRASPQKGLNPEVEVSKPEVAEGSDVEKTTSSEETITKPNLRASPQKSLKSKGRVKFEVSKPNLRASPRKGLGPETGEGSDTEETTLSEESAEATKPNLRVSLQKSSKSKAGADIEVSKRNLRASPLKPAKSKGAAKLETEKTISKEESNTEMSTSPQKHSGATKSKARKSGLRTSPQKIPENLPDLESAPNPETRPQRRTPKAKPQYSAAESPAKFEVNLETPPNPANVGDTKSQRYTPKSPQNLEAESAPSPKIKGRPRKHKPATSIETEGEAGILTRSSTPFKLKPENTSDNTPNKLKKEVKEPKRKSSRLSTKDDPRLGDIADDVELIKLALQEETAPAVEVKKEEDNEWVDVVVKQEPVSPITVQPEARFVDGDLAYARLGQYPYWPCMITKDPVSKLIRKKIGLQKWNITWSYHVRFFGDRGRRSWVRENKIIPLKGKNDFANNIKELKKEKKYLKIPAFKVPPKLLPAWNAGLDEALSLRSKTTDQRYEFFFDMFASNEEKATRVKEIVEPFEQVAVKQEALSDDEEPPTAKKKKKSSLQIDVASECSLSDTDSSSKWSVQTPLSVSNESQAALYKRNKLFRGVTRERVCVVCLKNGDVLKCKGKCYNFYHRTCAKVEETSDNVQIVDVKDRRYENPKLTLSNDRKFREMSLAEKIDFKLKEIMMPIVEKSTYADSTTDYTSSEESSSEKSSSVLVEHVAADDVIFATKLAKKRKAKLDDDFRCGDCSSGREPDCFACQRDVSSRGSVSRQKCSVSSCGRYYHPACLKPWPQTQFTLGSSAKDMFTCPTHVCHICVSDNPRAAISRVASDKVVRCVKCPATYHSNTFCIPAGTNILSATQIVCPRHLDHDPKGKLKRTTINATWCFICARGGDLVCCETCPTSVHAECSRLNLLAADDTFVCEECETGRLPLYDEIVWVKLGQYRWWPALILFPNDVPDNVRNLPHNPGEFVVKFFGTHDHYWVGRGRVFLFQEGDHGPPGGSKKKRVDCVFKQAVEEAAAVHNFKIEFKKNVEEATKSEEKPPHYIKIRLNRPVGNVKLFDGNISNTTPCNCDPNMANPCGVDSYCLNRLLMTECDPEVCPAGAKCQNQCFEKRQYPPLAPYKTEARGWGLKALAPIQKGQFIIEYVGEVIDLAEYQRRLSKMHEQMEDNYYFLTIDKDRMIDAGPKGNLARFMNHCCEPNSETQKWTVKGDTRVGLFATKDIPEDAEVTFNYNLECVGEEKKICKCGAPSCSGFIGVKAKSNNEEKKVKRQRKKRSPTPVLSPNVEPCFVCGVVGDTFACHNKICNKFYHLTCVKMDSMPDGKWSCPWHNCNLCSKRTIRCCVKCTNSYCPLHSEGNVRYDKLLGFICTEHDPTKEPQVLSTSPVKKTKKSSVSTEESDVTSTTQEEADGDGPKPEEPTVDDKRPAPKVRPALRLGGGVPYPKRKRGKQRRKLHLRKRIRFDEQYKHLCKAAPSAPEVILTSSVPERHLRVGRKTSEDSENDRLLKRQRAFEKDLPIRKRTTPRTESTDN